MNTFGFNLFRDNACAAEVGDLRFEEQAMIDGLRAATAAIEEMLPPWNVLGSILDRGQLLQPRQKACGVGDDYVVVDQHGGIARCYMELGKTLGDDPEAVRLEWMRLLAFGHKANVTLGTRETSVPWSDRLLLLATVVHPVAETGSTTIDLAVHTWTKR